MDLDLDLGVQVTCPPAPGEDFSFATSETDAAFLILAHLPGKHGSISVVCTPFNRRVR
jgi:hypothetical protein